MFFPLSLKMPFLDNYLLPNYLTSGTLPTTGTNQHRFFFLLQLCTESHKCTNIPSFHQSINPPPIPPNDEKKEIYTFRLFTAAVLYLPSFFVIYLINSHTYRNQNSHAETTHPPRAGHPTHSIKSHTPTLFCSKKRQQRTKRREKMKREKGFQKKTNLKERN